VPVSHDQPAPRERDDIARQVHALRLPSPGPVVARILDLTADPGASVTQYADAIRVDPVLSARLLRMANCALFAQRNVVTNLDRACVMLGIERVRGIAMGFHLANATTGDGCEVISRTVWCQSIYRGCLGGELARRLNPIVGAEGFTIGLMLDAGIPLMQRMFGTVYEDLWRQKLPPAELHQIERRILPFTHQDVIFELCRMWRLPRLLAGPISNHHNPPPAEPTLQNALERVAHYVGSVRLDADSTLEECDMLYDLAHRLFGYEREELVEIVRQARCVFDAVCMVFESVIDTIDEPTSLARRIEAWTHRVANNPHGMVQQLEIAGFLLVLRRVPDGIQVVAHDPSGEPIACSLRPRHLPLDLTLNGLDHELGLHSASLDERIRLKGVFEQFRAA